MKTVKSAATVWILFAGQLYGQAHFTLPKNVWRISVVKEASSENWVSAGGKKGLPDEYFTLDGYGLKYFDHLNPESKKDLVRLNEQYVSATDMTNKVIEAFQLKQAAIGWGDTLADFSQNFFGPDSVTIGGYISNTKRTMERQLTRIRFEYGLTERVTLTLGIPNYASATQTNEWGWRASHSENIDLEGFIDYHTTNKAKFENFFASPQYYDSLDTYFAGKLQAVYDAFYTTNGAASVLWVLEQGLDPLGTSITGAQFNPFSNSDKDTTNIDSLMKFYHPNRSTSGLGDIRWGLNFHLLGSPIWAGESLFSVYGGIGMTIPTAKLISKFNPDKVDGDSGRPKQFSQLQLGEGVSALHFSLFGEFYRTVRSREVKVNWSTAFKFNTEAKFWPRVTPRGTFSVQHDSILSQIGEVYRFHRGDELFGSLVGSLELIPRKLKISAGQTWYLKRRDSYYSKDKRWNEWMAGGTDLRKDYDTRSVMIFQDLALIFQNTDPMNQFGSTPFEAELSVTLPVLTRHAWHAVEIRVSFVTYFQFW